MIKKILSVIVTIIWAMTAIAQTAPSPGAILAKAVAIINGGKGCEATFKVYNSGYSGSGKITTSGNKFHVALPDVEVWYNGKEMYTYNKNAEETTVVLPTQEELSQSNPLAYVAEAQGKYNVTFSTVKKADRYVLELTPKSKKGEVKRITLTLKKNSYVPEKIVVEPVSGSPISADITGFKTGINVEASYFNYPAARYPKVELIDLR